MVLRDKKWLGVGITIVVTHQNVFQASASILSQPALPRMPFLTFPARVLHSNKLPCFNLFTSPALLLSGALWPPTTLRLFCITAPIRPSTRLFIHLYSHITEPAHPPPSPFTFSYIPTAPTNILLPSIFSTFQAYSASPVIHNQPAIFPPPIVNVHLRPDPPVKISLVIRRPLIVKHHLHSFTAAISHWP